MGGCGSGVWYRYNKRTTTAECLSIDVNRLARDGALRAECAGVVSWTNRIGSLTAALGFEVIDTDRGRLLCLSYRLNGKQDVFVPIRVQATEPHFGGLRWWFTCPMITNGKPCNRRVGKLYLRRYPGCRACHNLTYESCQESKAAKDFRRELGLPIRFPSWFGNPSRTMTE
jgi:hypothetical protein